LDDLALGISFGITKNYKIGPIRRFVLSSTSSWPPEMGVWWAYRWSCTLACFLFFGSFFNPLLHRTRDRVGVRFEISILCFAATETVDKTRAFEQRKKYCAFSKETLSQYKGKRKNNAEVHKNVILLYFFIF